LQNRPEAAYRRLLPLLDRGEQQETAVTRLLALLAGAHSEMGEVLKAQAVLSEAYNRANKHRMCPALIDVLRVRAQVDLQLSLFQEAQYLLEEVLLLSRTIGYPYLETKVLYVSGMLDAQRRDPAAARERFEQALAICERLGEELYRSQIRRELQGLN